MWRVGIGVLVGFLLAASIPSSEAVRLSKPPTITEWTPSSIAQLNAWMEAIWQLSNGRYTHEVTTTNPNSSPVRVGTRGDTVFYLNGSDWKFCVNTSATTASSPTGSTWRCSANAFTAP